MCSVNSGIPLKWGVLDKTGLEGSVLKDKVQVIGKRLIWIRNGWGVICLEASYCLCYMCAVLSEELKRIVVTLSYNSFRDDLMDPQGQ